MSSSPSLKIEDQFKKYIEKLKEKGKIFCEKCFDERDVIFIEGRNICRDCLYIETMLYEIKKI